MVSLLFEPERLATGTVLLLGAHSDDIEIGCGGTVLRLIEQFPRASYHWVVFSGVGRRGEEAAASARAFLGPVQQQVHVETFRDGYFPYQGAEIKEYFERLKGKVDPQLVFTHYRDDRHQDHRVISDLTWNTFRNHLILEYEIPKYDGDLGVPNFFVRLEEIVCQKKIDLLLMHFESQTPKHWFSEETFRALLRLRGMEAHADGHYAEAFYCRKLVAYL
jgi:LmbE family N-acetylglucosaminyl deacetylase